MLLMLKVTIFNIEILSEHAKHVVELIVHGRDPKTITTAGCRASPGREGRLIPCTVGGKPFVTGGTGDAVLATMWTEKSASHLVDATSIAAQPKFPIVFAPEEAWWILPPHEISAVSAHC